MVSYTLFYSKRCKFSREFINKLENYTNINMNFKKICVDSINPTVQQYLNKYKIKAVPSIVVNNNVYLGYEAFKWLDSQTTEINTIHSSLNKQSYSEHMKTGENGIGSLDDNFQGVPLQQQTGNGAETDSIIIPKSCQYNNAERPPTPPQLQPINCKKSPQEEYQNIMKNFEKERLQSVPANQQQYQNYR